MKFHSKPVPEHGEVPLPDDGHLEEIVDYWDERETSSHSGQNKSYVVSVGSDREPRARNAQLAEIVSLVRSQDDEVVGQEIFYLTNINPRTLLGKGQSQEIAARARAAGANLLVLDAELSPSQLRNLEDQAGISVSDREAVILNVFLRHANTRLARTQVELARLEYLRPRIRGVGINMDQQMGGANKSRGPGETASELLARKLDGRIIQLRKSLLKFGKARNTQRVQRHSCKTIALVGYTNAGKTSLMNALTDAGLSAKDRPFETLDTTSRVLTRHGGEVLITDTVGFIRRMPEKLLASFSSTLTEIQEAALIVIVVDVSDYEFKLHLETTEKILSEMQVENIPRLYVYNKVDLLPSASEDNFFGEISGTHPWMAVSSRNPRAITQLKEELLRTVRSDQRADVFEVPYGAADLLSLIYGKCRVLNSDSNATGLVLSVEGAPLVLDEVHRRLKELQ